MEQAASNKISQQNLKSWNNQQSSPNKRPNSEKCLEDGIAHEDCKFSAGNPELQDVRRVCSLEVKNFTNVKDYMTHLMNIQQSNNSNTPQQQLKPNYVSLNQISSAHGQIECVNQNSQKSNGEAQQALNQNNNDYNSVFNPLIIQNQSNSQVSSEMQKIIPQISNQSIMAVHVDKNPAITQEDQHRILNNQIVQSNQDMAIQGQTDQYKSGLQQEQPPVDNRMNQVENFEDNKIQSPPIIQQNQIESLLLNHQKQKQPQILQKESLLNDALIMEVEEEKEVISQIDFDSIRHKDISDQSQIAQQLISRDEPIDAQQKEKLPATHKQILITIGQLKASEENLDKQIKNPISIGSYQLASQNNNNEEAQNNQNRGQLVEKERQLKAIHQDQEEEKVQKFADNQNINGQEKPTKLSQGFSGIVKNEQQICSSGPLFSNDQSISNNLIYSIKNVGEVDNIRLNEIRNIFRKQEKNQENQHNYIGQDMIVPSQNALENNSAYQNRNQDSNSLNMDINMRNNLLSDSPQDRGDRFSLIGQAGKDGQYQGWTRLQNPLQEEFNNLHREGRYQNETPRVENAYIEPQNFDSNLNRSAFYNDNEERKFNRRNLLLGDGLPLRVNAVNLRDGEDFPCSPPNNLISQSHNNNNVLGNEANQNNPFSRPNPSNNNNLLREQQKRFISEERGNQGSNLEINRNVVNSNDNSSALNQAMIIHIRESDRQVRRNYLDEVNPNQISAWYDEYNSRQVSIKQEDVKQIKEPAQFKFNFGKHLKEELDGKEFQMDSNDTSPRSIPEEHDLSDNYEDHYLESYMCLMKGITWGRESHGLFDYGTRHPLKKQMKTEIEQTLVRTQNNDLYLVNPDSDLKKMFDKQAQPLLNIRKQKNKFYLEALKVPKKDDLIPHIQSEVPNQNNLFNPAPVIPINPAPINVNNNQGVAGAANNNNNGDGDEGSQFNCDVRERMYLIVRSMQNGEEKVPYKLKRHDIIKLGRVLFKIIEMRIEEQEDQKIYKRWKEKRRQLNQRKFIRRQEKLKLEEQQKIEQECICNMGAHPTYMDGAQDDQAQSPVNQIQNCNCKDLKQEKPLGQLTSNGSVFIEDEEAQKLLFIDYDEQIQTCRECLEGEQNCMEIDCLAPEPSLKIKLIKEKELRQKQKEQKNLDKIQMNIKHHHQCNSQKNLNNLHNKTGKAGRNYQICVTQQQSQDNLGVPQNFSYLNNSHNIENVMSQRKPNDISGKLQASLKQKGVRRPKSSGRQIIAKEDGEVQQQSRPKNENSNKFSSKLIDKQLNEDQKEEESLSNIHKDNEFAITKMDPNEVIGNEDVALNSDANRYVDKDSPLCRFCWGSEISIQNPLLSSCKCKGGICYIHFGCLKEWLNTKRTVKEQPIITSYYYKSFECELCKTPYPLVFKANGKRYNLIDSSKMKADYMMIESLTLEQNLQRIVHVIQPTTFVKSINLGRGHESDLRVNDISVSRCHAMIKLKKDGFYLKDNKSKFGTLVLIKHRLSLSPKMTKAVQVGRTVINFCVKRSPEYAYKVGYFHKINKRNKVVNNSAEESKDKQDENENGIGGLVNLDQQRAKLLKHLENMQQAEDYIQKQAAEHQRLANGDHFHQRRYLVQQNIHEEEIKIDFELRYPQLIHQNIIQVQNNLPSSLIRMDDAFNNNNNIININNLNNPVPNLGAQIQGRAQNQLIPPGQENLGQEDEQRHAIQQIGSVVRDSEMFNLLRRSDAHQPGSLNNNNNINLNLNQQSHNQQQINQMIGSSALIVPRGQDQQLQQQQIQNPVYNSQQQQQPALPNIQIQRL